MFVVSNNNMPRQSAAVTATAVDAIAAAAAAVERKAIASSIVRRTGRNFIIEMSTIEQKLGALLNAYKRRGRKE